MPADSEYRAYAYIEQVLKDLGWDTKNPAKGGSVYTQGEFRKHDPLLSDALGRKTPENIICIPWDGGLRYWIVEAKRQHSDLPKSVSEAKGYSNKINDLRGGGAARFCTGIAGSPDDSFLVSTCYWNGQEWQEVCINDHKTTGFLSQEQCADILEQNTHNIARFDDDPERFLRKANAINKTLHENGIAVGDRAKVMGALLLALADDGTMRIHSDPTKMLSEINGNIRHILAAHRKEEFANTIGLSLPATAKNHKGFRQGIVETLQHLREMNVRSAINSGDDALGKFYETFLKYANGAKEMGIVLTPRHITRFAVNVLGITAHDKIFDPACGTGGFLVSAMDEVRQRHKSDKAYADFKENGIFGVEKEDPVYGLALVNMIFRGDGKSGIQDGNCFEHEFWYRDGKVLCLLPNDEVPDGAVRPFSKVLMNPPFKSEKAPEPKFVDHALKQMKSDGLLFAVLPAIVISGNKYSDWRASWLKRHTLKGVVKFDKNLFYPIQEGTYGLILQAHRPHIEKNDVFFGVLFDDKHRPRKSKMLSEHEAVDNVPRLTANLRNFMLGKPVDEPNIAREQITTSINLDEGCVFAPEAYIANKQPVVAPALADRAIELKAARLKGNVRGRQSPAKTTLRLKGKPLSDFIEKTIRPPLQSIKGYPAGNVPVVSATASYNGIADWKDVPDNKCLRGCISISKTHNTLPCQAFWHPYDFTAIGTVHIFRPVPIFRDEYAALYLCQSITDTNAWRYDYARSVDLNELEVFLPIKEDGSLDYAAIIAEGKRQAGDIL